jgi:hypothetical protein
VDLINAEIEVLHGVVAEIYDTERRNDLSREYEKKENEDNPKSYKVKVIS